MKSYADFVHTLLLPDEYLERSRIIVQNTADFIFNELVADGRRGACIDISGLVLRFLERQDIWCYVVCGGVRVEFPPGSRIVTKYFYPLMHHENRAFTGHAWIFAPPFQIVDLSISRQPYSSNERRYFHGYTIVENPDPPIAPIGALDLMEGELVEDFQQRHRRLPTMDDIADVRELIGEYPPLCLTKDDLNFTYMPIKFSAPDLPLEKMLQPTLSGRLPMQVFEEFRNR